MREEFPLIARVAAQMGKPVAFFDIETTGLPNGGPVGILEFAYLAVFPDGRTEGRSYLVNPGGIPIDPGAAKVHGITEETVANAPEFPAISHVVTILFDRACCVAFNGTAFDLPILQENFERYGLPVPEPSHFIDARKIWTEMQQTPRGTLLKVAEHYGVEPGKAHRAQGDTITTARVVEEMIFHHGADTVFGSEAPSPGIKELRRPPQARGGKQGPEADRVRAAIDAVLAEGHNTLAGFILAMAEHQIRTKIVPGSAAGDIFWIRFESADGSVSIKGSDLGSGYSWKGLIARGMRYNPDRDFEAVRAALNSNWAAHSPSSPFR